MPAIGKIAPRNRTSHLAVKFKDDESGDVEYVNLEYYKNRSMLAPMEALIPDEVAEDLTDDQLDSARIASNICNLVKSWDVEGPLHDYRGNVVVAEGEIVPLDPMQVMYIPSSVNGEIIRAITSDMFPDQGKSRNERRRSR